MKRKVRRCSVSRVTSSAPRLRTARSRYSRSGSLGVGRGQRRSVEVSRGQKRSIMVSIWTSPECVPAVAAAEAEVPPGHGVAQQGGGLLPPVVPRLLTLLLHLASLLPAPTHLQHIPFNLHFNCRYSVASEKSSVAQQYFYKNIFKTVLTLLLECFWVK